jgi:hypothetical protein
MAFLYNAGQLGTIITKLSEMDVGDLGNSQTNQNTFIYYYMNVAMMKLARLAYNVKFSDVLAFTTDGYYTFKLGNVAIADMFEPMAIYATGDVQMQKRTAYDAPVGWWRESNNLEIHLRGLVVGNYTLKYVKYPARVTLDTDTVEFPPSGYDALIKEVVSLIKYSKNSLGDAEFINAQAKQSMGLAAQGSISAKGTGSSGQPVGPMDVAAARGV